MAFGESAIAAITMTATGMQLFAEGRAIATLAAELSLRIESPRENSLNSAQRLAGEVAKSSDCQDTVHGFWTVREGASALLS